MTNSQENTLTFEHALAELEQIVRDLEGGQIGLEDALSRYERGVGLLKGCYSQLNQVEQRIQYLAGMDAEGKPILRAFNHSSSAEAEKADTGRRRKKAEDPDNLF